jgi:hypothetical protein
MRLITHHAGVAELVDAPDLKSVGPQGPCRFDPGRPYQRFAPQALTLPIRTTVSPRGRATLTFQVRLMAAPFSEKASILMV